MKIHFCGAAGTTTGSQHLLEVNGCRILLDCGMYQGRREEAWHINKDFPYFSPAEVDAVVLSHAHIDHSGNLPNLVKQGFQGNIYSTLQPEIFASSCWRTPPAFRSTTAHSSIR